MPYPNMFIYPKLFATLIQIAYWMQTPLFALTSKRQSSVNLTLIKR